MSMPSYYTMYASVLILLRLHMYTKTLVSCDYVCMLSPNKDKTGHRVSQKLLLMVV